MSKSITEKFKYNSKHNLSDKEEQLLKDALKIVITWNDLVELTYKSGEKKIIDPIENPAWADKNIIRGHFETCKEIDDPVVDVTYAGNKSNVEKRSKKDEIMRYFTESGLSINEYLNSLDRKCMNEGLRMYDLRGLYEDVAGKLSPEDKQEIKKVMDSTNDPEIIAAAIVSKSQKKEDFDYDGDLEPLNETIDEADTLYTCPECGCKLDSSKDQAYGFYAGFCPACNKPIDVDVAVEIKIADYRGPHEKELVDPDDELDELDYRPKVNTDYYEDNDGFINDLTDKYDIEIDQISESKVNYPWKIYIYGQSLASKKYINEFETEEEAEAFCEENNYEWVDPETTFVWNMDYEEKNNLKESKQLHEGYFEGYVLSHEYNFPTIYSVEVGEDQVNSNNEKYRLVKLYLLCGKDYVDDDITGFDGQAWVDANQFVDGIQLETLVWYPDEESLDKVLKDADYEECRKPRVIWHYDELNDKWKKEVTEALSESLNEDDAENKINSAEEIRTCAVNVMAAYQNANKWLDSIKETVYSKFSSPFFSSYIHTLAHKCPSEFDKFGDILHTTNMEVPYPATEEIEKLPDSIDEVFVDIFNCLDDIKNKLTDFIVATDKVVHGMSCAAEGLLNDIESEYPMLYRLRDKWTQCNGDLVTFDKYVMQYVEHKGDLLESLNEDIKFQKSLSEAIEKSSEDTGINVNDFIDRVVESVDDEYFYFNGDKDARDGYDHIVNSIYKNNPPAFPDIGYYSKSAWDALPAADDQYLFLSYDRLKQECPEYFVKKSDIPDDAKIFESIKESYEPMFKFKVGDTFEHAGLYGGMFYETVVSRTADTITTKEEWTAEDTGEDTSSTVTYPLEQQEFEGLTTEAAILYEYKGHKGYGYPPEYSKEADKIIFGDQHLRDNESLNEKLVPASLELQDELENAFLDNGFEIESKSNDSFWEDNIHYQVINTAADIGMEPTKADYHKYLDNLIAKIDELEKNYNASITWNFGPNDHGILTGGVDIHDMWIEESLDESIVSKKDIIDAAKIFVGDYRQGKIDMNKLHAKLEMLFGSIGAASAWLKAYIQTGNDGLTEDYSSLTESVNEDEIFNYLDSIKNIGYYHNKRDSLMNAFHLNSEQASSYLNKWLNKNESLDEAMLSGTVDFYKQKINRYYNNFDPFDISLEDLDDIDSSISKFLTGNRYDCSSYVASVAKALDKFNIPYRVYVGAADNKDYHHKAINRLKEKDFVNHCWLIGNGKVYEYPIFKNKLYSYEIDINESLHESIMEDLDEEPYTYEQIEAELKDLTNNFTEDNIILRCSFDQEKDYGREILKQHYKNVEISDGRSNPNQDMIWVLNCSEPFTENESLNEEVSSSEILSYNDYLADSFDGYTGDGIDNEIKILNRAARLLHTHADKMFVIPVYDDDIYDYCPEYFGDVDAITGNGALTLYNYADINIVQDNINQQQSNLWFKTNADAEAYLKLVQSNIDNQSEEQ